jgi:hypothetical protein
MLISTVVGAENGTDPCNGGCSVSSTFTTTSNYKHINVTAELLCSGHCVERRGFE